MSSEMVFTVTGSSATAATPVGLADVGLREREHLQEWVIENADMLGGQVKVVTAEFGRWTGSTSNVERDRLDILALDANGTLVVVELKRDKAPDTVDMQALKYAALTSRFTIETLAQVHADHLSRRGNAPVSPDRALQEMIEWAPTLSDDSLRMPRVVIMASAFPKTVTATVVFLHQQLSLDVRLVTFQAYKTEPGGVLILIASQHYPPPDVEEFILSPEARKTLQERAEKQDRQREGRTVHRLLAHGMVKPGDHLTFQAPPSLRAVVEDWLNEFPERRRAVLQDDGRVVWDYDGQSYSTSGLTRHILGESGQPPSQLQGPAYWSVTDGISLRDLARDLPSSLG